MITYQQVKLMRRCFNWAKHYKEDNMDYSEDYNNLPEEEVDQDGVERATDLDILQRLVAEYPEETERYLSELNWKITGVKNGNI